MAHLFRECVEVHLCVGLEVNKQIYVVQGSSRRAKEDLQGVEDMVFFFFKLFVTNISHG